MRLQSLAARQNRGSPPSVCAPAAETMIRLERFWKSYTPSGELKRAVREVGRTWFGPAQ